MPRSITDGKLWLSAVIPLYWFSLYTYTPYLTDHIVSLGASLSYAGIVTGLYGLVQMLLRIPTGIWSDRIGRRKPFVLAGCILSSASAFGLLLAKTPAMILIFRCLAGAAATCWVQISVLYTSYYKGEKASGAVSSALALNTFGQLAGVACGTFITIFFPVSVTFLLALVGGLLGLVFSFLVSETPHARPEGKFLQTILADRSALFRLLSASTLAILAQIMLFGGPNEFAPRVAKVLFSASPLQMGFLTMASTTTIVIGSRFVSPYLSKRIGIKKTLVMGFSICSLYFLTVSFLQNFTSLILMQALYGFGQGTVFPVLMGVAINGISEERRGVYMGVFQSVYGLGMFLGPWLVGILGDWLGLAAGFTAIGAVGLIALGMTLLLRYP